MIYHQLYNHLISSPSFYNKQVLSKYKFIAQKHLFYVQHQFSSWEMENSNLLNFVLFPKDKMNFLTFYDLLPV